MKAHIYSNFVWILLLRGALLGGLLSCSDEGLLEEKASSANSISVVLSSSGTEDYDISSPEGLLFVNGTLVQKTHLHAGVNDINVNHRENEAVTLKVLAKGFEPMTIELADALRSPSAATVNVALKPAMGLAITTFGDDDLYVIELEGSGFVEVEWPDGTVESGMLPLSAGRELDTGTGRQILLKGDVQGITSFRAFGYNTAITDISGLKHMRQLATFLPGMLRSADALDFRHNKMLQTVDLFEARLPEWIKLPEQHVIESFTLTLGDRHITTEEIDMLVDNIYKNSVRRDIYGGTISLSGSDTPSANALDKIQILEERFQWNIDLNR